MALAPAPAHSLAGDSYTRRKRVRIAIPKGVAAGDWATPGRIRSWRRLYLRTSSRSSNSSTIKSQPSSHGCLLPLRADDYIPPKQRSMEHRGAEGEYITRLGGHQPRAINPIRLSHPPSTNPANFLLRLTRPISFAHRTYAFSQSQVVCRESVPLHRPTSRGNRPGL